MLKLYSIYDKKTELYARPFYERTHETAVRAVRIEVNRPADDNTLYHYPKDFTLHHVGDWNDETGTLSGSTPTLLCELEALRNKEENQS